MSEITKYTKDALILMITNPLDMMANQIIERVVVTINTEAVEWGFIIQFNI